MLLPALYALRHEEVSGRFANPVSAAQLFLSNSTDVLINRLIAFAVKTGLLTSVTIIVDFIVVCRFPSLNGCCR